MSPDTAKSFEGLSRLGQAVLAFATLLCTRHPEGMAQIARIKRSLAITEEEWACALAELHSAGLMWTAGDEQDHVETTPTFELCIGSPAPTNRPKARDWEDLRVRVFARCFGDYDLEPHCLYCGERGVPLELDHILPLSRGGSNHFLNLMPACKSCNASKGAKTYVEWMASE